MSDDTAPRQVPLGSDRERPAAVTAAATLAGVEAVALAGYAVSQLVSALPFRDNVVTRAALTGGVVAFLLLSAGALAWAAHALLRLHHWPRPLLVVVQLIAIAVLLPFASAGSWPAWVAVVVCAAVAMLVLAPATTAAVGRRARG